MDAKPQRRTRIRDENDLAQIGPAVGRRKVMASTAVNKTVSGTSQRLEQPAKRIALADSTRYEAAVTNKISDQPSKSGLHKPAVRGKALAAKNAAPLATGAKSHHQPLGLRSDAPSSKSMVYRDNQESQSKGPSRDDELFAPAGARNAPARKRPFVYRDEPETAAPVVAPLMSEREDVDLFESEPCIQPSSLAPLDTIASSFQGQLPNVASEDVAVAKPGSELFRDDLSEETLAGTDPDLTPKASQCPSVVPSDTESERNPLDSDYNADESDLKSVCPVVVRENICVGDQMAVWVHPTGNPRVELGSHITPHELMDPVEATNLWQAEQDAKIETDNKKGDHDAEDRDKVIDLFAPAPFEDTCHTPAETEATETLPAVTRLYPQWNDEIKREVKRAHDICQHPSFQEQIADDNDPNYVAEYADEILCYLMNLDLTYLPDPHYMENQPDLRWDMRGTLIDWLIEVHERFQMVSETLYNAVNIIDRFLTRKAIPVDQLQLVGITALFIAAKYEEITPPAIESLVYMVDDAYNVDEIRSCEAYILRILGWEINAPGPMNFLRYISTADQYQWDIRALAKYFLETTLMDPRFVGTPMSYITAASYYLARIMLNEGDWNLKHIHYSGYTSEQLRPAVEVLIEMMGVPSVHHPATFSKYSDKKFKRVAAFVEKWMVAQFQSMPPSPTNASELSTAQPKKKTSKKGSKNKSGKTEGTKQSSAQGFNPSIRMFLPSLKLLEQYENIILISLQQHQ
ncbi:Cyclin-A2-1 [Dactylellina cionopaga]|nr:Cyclin-A2-1 [Dactylellina cionopaga]